MVFRRSTRAKSANKRPLLLQRNTRLNDDERRVKEAAWRQHIEALSSRYREEGERDTAPRLFLSGPVLAPEKKRAFYVK